MRLVPDPDPDRERAMGAAARAAVGAPLRYLDDGPDIASLVIAALWHWPRPPEGDRAAKAFCVVMAMATDALRSARASLLIGDFGGVFVQLRRAAEMQTLAVSFGLDGTEAERWLAGGPVSQVRLRRRIEQDNAPLAELFRTSYSMFSDEAHGRSQALGAYENAGGVFDWPPHAEALDPARARASYITILAVLMGQFAVLNWMVRGWESLPASLAKLVAAYYDGLTGFVVDHQAHGDWQTIAPGQAAEWLGLAPCPLPGPEGPTAPLPFDG
jgi:hypothetical protein